MFTVCQRGKCTELNADYTSSCERFKAYYLDIEKSHCNVYNLKQVCEDAGKKLEQILCYNHQPVKAWILVSFLLKECKEFGGIIKTEVNFQTNTELLMLGDILSEANKERYLNRCLETLCESFRVRGRDINFFNFSKAILQTEKYVPMTEIDSENQKDTENESRNQHT